MSNPLPTRIPPPVVKIFKYQHNKVRECLDEIRYSLETNLLEGWSGLSRSWRTATGTSRRPSLRRWQDWVQGMQSYARWHTYTGWIDVYISSSRQSPFQRSTRPSRTSRSPSSLDKTQTTSNTPTDPNLFPPLPLNLPHPPTSPSTPISLSPPSSQTASLPRRRIRLLSPTSDDGRRWRRTILIPSVWRRRKRRRWKARGREMRDGSEAWTRRGQRRREGRRWKNV